jgi:hypothetical protein
VIANARKPKCSGKLRSLASTSFLVVLSDFAGITPVRMFAKRLDAENLARKLAQSIDLKTMSTELAKRLQLSAACRFSEISIVAFVDGVPFNRVVVGKV